MRTYLPDQPDRDLFSAAVLGRLFWTGTVFADVS